jgi:outer membrane lipoprotein-sorting protein
MGQQIKMNMIADGEFVWSEIVMPGMEQKLVQKYSLDTMQKMSGAGTVTPTQAVQDIRKRYYFTSSKEDKLDGRDVYVLEGTMNKDFIDEHCKKMEEMVGAQAAEMTRTQMELMKKSRMYVDKTDLLVRKLETLAEDNTPIVTLEMSNIKTGQKYDDAKFKYTAPEGATVQDMDEAFRMSKQVQNLGNDGGAMPVPEEDDDDDDNFMN